MMSLNNKCPGLCEAAGCNIDWIIDNLNGARIDCMDCTRVLGYRWRWSFGLSSVTCTCARRALKNETTPPRKQCEHRFHVFMKRDEWKNHLGALKQMFSFMGSKGIPVEVFFTEFVKQTTEKERHDLFAADRDAKAIQGSNDGTRIGSRLTKANFDWLVSYFALTREDFVCRPSTGGSWALNDAVAKGNKDLCDWLDEICNFKLEEGRDALEFLGTQSPDELIEYLIERYCPTSDEMFRMENRLRRKCKILRDALPICVLRESTRSNALGPAVSQTKAAMLIAEYAGIVKIRRNRQNQQ